MKTYSRQVVENIREYLSVRGICTSWVSDNIEVTIDEMEEFLNYVFIDNKMLSDITYLLNQEEGFFFKENYEKPKTYEEIIKESEEQSKVVLLEDLEHEHYLKGVLETNGLIAFIDKYVEDRTVSKLIIEYIK